MWTEEMVQELRRLVDTEHGAYSKRHFLLGCTKNAVCGKLYRMKPRPPRHRATKGYRQLYAEKIWGKTSPVERSVLVGATDRQRSSSIIRNVAQAFRQAV